MESFLQLGGGDKHHSSVETFFHQTTFYNEAVIFFSIAPHRGLFTASHSLLISAHIDNFLQLNKLSNFNMIVVEFLLKLILITFQTISTLNIYTK